jgi:hypothetical protein
VVGRVSDTVKINDILDQFDNLNFEDKEYLHDIISKRLIENRREQIKQAGIEAEKDYREGRAKSGTVADLLKDLNG